MAEKRAQEADFCAFEDTYGFSEPSKPSLAVFPVKNPRISPPSSLLLKSPGTPANKLHSPLKPSCLEIKVQRCPPTNPDKPLITVRRT